MISYIHQANGMLWAAEKNSGNNQEFRSGI